eukprot:1137992-Pelagomonas_calceolata.AAC.4
MGMHLSSDPVFQGMAVPGKSSMVQSSLKQGFCTMNIYYLALSRRAAAHMLLERVAARLWHQGCVCFQKQSIKDMRSVEYLEGVAPHTKSHAAAKPDGNAGSSPLFFLFSSHFFVKKERVA